MATPEQLSQHLERIRQFVGTDSTPAGLIIATSVEKEPVYTLDDSVFRYTFGVLIQNSYLLVTKNLTVVLYNGDHAADKIKDLAIPDQIIIAEISGSVSDKIEEYCKESLLATEEASERSELSGLHLQKDSAKIEEILITHIQNEFSRIRNAGRVADGALNKVFKKEMEATITNGEPTTLRIIAKDTKKDLNNPEKVSSKLVPSDVEPAFYPAVQSGNSISVDFPPQTGSGNLTADFINCTIGIRFKSYNAVVGRTFIINGTDGVKEAYENLVKAHEAAIQECKPENTLGAVYRAFIGTLDEKYRQYAPKCIGGFCGAMLITKYHQITDDSEEKIPHDCSIILACNLKDVALGTEPPFTLSLVDTIQITGDEDPTPVTNVKSKYKHISYSLDNDDETKQIEEMLKDNRPIYERTRNKVDPKKRQEEDEEAKELFEAIKKEKKERTYTKDVDEEIDEDDVKSFDSHEQMKYSSTKNIIVQKQKMTVLLPISGIMVPFHISVIKNVLTSVSSDGKTSSITIQLETPKQNDTEAKKYHIKELIYTKNGNQYFDSVAKEIKNLKTNYKNFIKKEKEQKSLYRGEALKILVPPQGKNIPRLTGIHIRPTPSGKKTIGTLEAHTNGFRFKYNGGKLDVIYRNIQLAIYQPGESDNELMTLIHLYLKKPIAPVGNSGPPTNHITFFKPLGETSVELGKTSNSMTDQAEFAEEEHDRKVRKKINKDFKAFIKSLTDEDLKIEDPPTFEKPKRQLRFEGSYARQKANIYPMVSSLISVTEVPPLVLLTDDIDVAVFEREQLSLNYFDLTFVFNDWTRDPVQISQIPVAYNQNIKDWLNAINVRFFVSSSNVDWKMVLPKLVKDGREKFVKEVGGWDGFFQVDEEEDNSEDDDPGWKEDAEEDEVDDDEDEEFDAVDEDDEDEEMQPTDDDDEDGGKSWRQLDEEAEEADRRSEMKDRGHHHHHHHHHKH